MDDSADVVQKVLAAAAEGNGEFELPLKPARVAAMRAALMERRELVSSPPLMAWAAATGLWRQLRPVDANWSFPPSCRPLPLVPLLAPLAAHPSPFSAKNRISATPSGPNPRGSPPPPCARDGNARCQRRYVRCLRRCCYVRCLRQRA